MSFPASPVQGDTFTVEDTTWKFNGLTWDRILIGVNNNTRYTQNGVIEVLLNRIVQLESRLDKQFLILD